MGRWISTGSRCLAEGRKSQVVVHRARRTNNRGIPQTARHLTLRR